MLDNSCKDFQHEGRQISAHLTCLVKDIAQYLQSKASELSNQRLLFQIFDKYEELNLVNYEEGDTSKLVFGSSQTAGNDIKESINTLTTKLRNPYFNMFHWAKGELFDLEAVLMALKQKEEISQNILKYEKKKRSTQENLDNVTTGRKTVKTMFKNEGDTGKMVNKIENVSTSFVM